MVSCLQLKVRDERLGEASELQKFLQNLDHFQQWLTRTQMAIASEDIPQVCFKSLYAFPFVS